MNSRKPMTGTNAALTRQVHGSMTPLESVPDYPDILQQEELDLSKYLRIIRKHLWSILGLSVSVAILTYLILLTQTPIYRAASSVIIEAKSNKTISIDDVDAPSGRGAEYFNTQIEVLKSHQLARRVAEKLARNPGSAKAAGMATPSGPGTPGKNSVMKDWLGDIEWPELIHDLISHVKSVDYQPEIDPLDTQAKELLAKLTLTPVRGTSIVEVAIEHSDPRQVVEIANLWGKTYIELQSEVHASTAQESSRWLADRLDKLRQDLLSAEKSLHDYMEEQGLFDLESGDDGKSSAGVMSLSASELADRQNKLNEARRHRMEIESLHRQISSQNKIPFESLPAFPGIADNASVQALLGQQHEAKAHLDQIAGKYGVAHPERRAAETRLAAIHAALQQQMASAMTGIKHQLEAARRTEQALEESLDQSKSKIHVISRNDSRLNELRREVDTNRSLYEMFFNRLKETNETRDLSPSNIRILDLAQPPIASSKPNKRLGTLIAGLMALAVGIALAFLLEQLDTTLKSPEEIEEKLGIPFLGVLPFDKTTQAGIMVSYDEDGLSSFAESVRSIRTGVIFGTLNHPRPVITITSSGPSEGKTTAILNLAASMAQLKRVLLIEADLRKPQLGKRMNLSPRSPGICNLIVGDEELANCVYPIRENLDLIPSGRIPPNPLEMLSSPRFGELIEGFREEYDIIIVDAPPVGPVSDPLVLSRIADAVLFVIRAQKTPVRQVQQAVSKLRRVQAPMTGVILNFAEVMRDSGYKYQSYYYNYGYGYGEYKSDKADHGEA